MCYAVAYRRRMKNKKIPEGWELIEEVIEDFEAQMKVLHAVRPWQQQPNHARCTESTLVLGTATHSCYPVLLLEPCRRR